MFSSVDQEGISHFELVECCACVLILCGWKFSVEFSVGILCVDVVLELAHAERSQDSGIGEGKRFPGANILLVK